VLLQGLLGHYHSFVRGIILTSILTGEDLLQYHTNKCNLVATKCHESFEAENAEWKKKISLQFVSTLSPSHSSWKFEIVRTSNQLLLCGIVCFVFRVMWALTVLSSIKTWLSESKRVVVHELSLVLISKQCTFWYIVAVAPVEEGQEAKGSIRNCLYLRPWF
jgi:hypothetical protein